MKVTVEFENGVLELFFGSSCSVCGVTLSTPGAFGH